MNNQKNLNIIYTVVMVIIAAGILSFMFFLLEKTRKGDEESDSEYCARIAVYRKAEDLPAICLKYYGSGNTE